MTPPAPAGRTRTSRRSAQQIPRRVSGPAGGRAGAAAKPRPVRRVATPPRVRFERPLTGRVRTAVLARAIALVRSLPDHQLLDRVVRGRAWIPLLGVLLAGIVAMQVEVLKLGASIGRSIESSSALSSRNELLRASVASLADDQRIERLAAAQGMVMPPPDHVGFLSRQPAHDLARALSNIHQPNAVSFLALISPNGAVVTGASQSVGGGSSGGGTGTLVAPAAAATGPAQAPSQIAAGPAQASPQIPGG